MLVFHGIPEIPHIDLNTGILMLMVSTVTALGYAAWNIGIIKGNITILVTLSYFSPIFSSLISMFILQTNLSLSFWHGAILVTVGSLICWISTSWPQIKTKLQLLKSAH